MKCTVLRDYGCGLNKVGLLEFREGTLNPTGSGAQMQIVFCAIVFGSPFFSEGKVWSQQNFLSTAGETETKREENKERERELLVWLWTRLTPHNLFITKIPADSTC